jgi:uncharacterized membrane protein YhfC
MSLGLGLIVIGGALAVIIGWLANRITTQESFLWTGLVVGGVAFLLAGILQNLMVAPMAITIHGRKGLQPLDVGSALEALYYGIAAGIAQELVKLAGIRVYGRNHPIIPTAIAIGAGFALTEIILVSLPVVQGSPVAVSALAIPVWERFSAILFHTGSAAIIGYGLVRGKMWLYLLIAIVLHAIPDSAVGLMGYYKINQIYAFETINLIYSAIVLGVAIRWLQSMVREHEPLVTR